MEHEQLECRLVAYVDDELTEEERREFESLLENRPDLQAEIDAYQRIREAARELRLRRPPPEFWDEYPRGVMARLERRIGWLLLILGSIGLTLFAVVGVWWSQDLPLTFKIPASFLLGGLAILLSSVARRRWAEAKTDPYERIIR